MSENPKTKVQSQFGVAADDYATSDVHARGESLDVLLEIVQPKSDWKVLDVATGAGHTALVFAPHVASVTAGDLTVEMLQKVSELAATRGIKNIETRSADAEQLPFADGEFDLLTCRLAFHHFPNPEKALAEFARVVKPGGVLAMTDNFTVEDEQAAAYYNEYEKLRDPSHHRVWSLSELRAMLTSAGFQVRATRELSKEMEFQEWADRQRVSDGDKQRLLEMMRAIPAPLEPLFAPRWAEGTMFFSLWEAVIVADRSGD